MNTKLIPNLFMAGGLALVLSVLHVAEARAAEIVGNDGTVPFVTETLEGAPTLSPGTGSVQIIPSSPTVVTNCMPFGNNTVLGFSGFIYRNVPAFNLPVGARIRFDLGNLNDVDTRRNIFFGTANKNPAPAPSMVDVISQGITVNANGWTQIVTDDQIPLNPRGNTIQGDYELTYIAEAPFAFPGGGLLIAFQGSPPASFADSGCEQVLVTTDGGDASGNFYARFVSKPNLSLGVLDSGTGGTGRNLGGFILDNLFLEVAIDIQPGTDTNSINLCSNGGVPVAILGSESFDVNDIDTESLTLAEAAVKVVGKKDPNILCSVEDVNGDSFDDLVCHFLTQDLAALDGMSTSAELNGELVDNTPFKGSDSVNIVKKACF